MARKFSHKSITWGIFTQTFLELPPERLPFMLDQNKGKGWAVNLAVGLNTCQQQWQQERQIPDELIQISAKAKPHPAAPPKSTHHWVVEISTSPKHTGRRSDGSLTLSNLLSQLQDMNRKPEGEQPHQNTSEPEDKDSVFDSWLKDAPTVEHQATPEGLENRSVPQPVKKYTKEDLLAKGWTFDDQGKPTPPKRQ